jgi:hypothetical protein
MSLQLYYNVITKYNAECHFKIYYNVITKYITMSLQNILQCHYKIYYNVITNILQCHYVKQLYILKYWRKLEYQEKNHRPVASH